MYAVCVHGQQKMASFNMPLAAPSVHPPTVQRKRSETTSEYEERCDFLTDYELDDIEASGKLLGKGAYGVVMELKFRGLKCAGKKLHDILVEKVSSKEKACILERFRAECSILSQVRHPNIVQFLGVYYEEGSHIPVLVMEHLLMTLADCIEQNEDLPNELGYSILHDVALGLCYLHGYKPNPIIHRDLSANNVLLTQDMTAKIADLGVAKILNLTPAKMTQMTVTPGTPAYMPPEALVPNPKYKTEIDVFSYGVIILHLFSGVWPLPGEPVTPDPQNPDKLIPRSEVERREEYFQKMGGDHPLTALTMQCLHNHPPKRPKASELLQVVEEKQSMIPSTVGNRIQFVRCLEQMKKDNYTLNSKVASLKAEIRNMKQEIDPDIESLSSSEWSQEIGIRMRENSFSSTGSIQEGGEMVGVYISRRAVRYRTRPNTAQTCPISSDIGQSHPCQPGAKFVLDKRCSDIPVAMNHAHAVVLMGTVYTGGGTTKGQAHDNTVLKYDATLDKWSMLPPCPVTSFGLASYSDKLVAVGGINSSGGDSNMIYSFHEDENEWKRTLPPMSSARHSLTAIGYLSNLFACGGRNATGVTNVVEVFINDTYQWYKTHPLPFPCYYMSSTVIHGFWYLLGGYDQFAFTNKVVYTSLASLVDAARSLSGSTKQISSKSPWESLCNLRDSYAAAANLGGCLLAIGGIHNFGPAKVYIYSQLTKSGSWVKLTDLVGRKSYLAPAIAELDNGKLLIIGGATSNFELRTSVYKGKILYL